MTEREREDIRCQVLILVTTRSEREALEAVAKEAGLRFERRRVEPVGRYYFLGSVGSIKVNAVPTEIGPLGHRGSAAISTLFASLGLDLGTPAPVSGIVQLGMGFGVDPTSQCIGDVLVSTSLIPYDNRDVVVEPATIVAEPIELLHESSTLEPEAGSSGESTSGDPAWNTERPYSTDYSRANRVRASESLFAAFQKEAQRGGYSHRVFFGGMLSGGAKIFSSRFLKELVRGVPSAEDGIIGGDMEGVGLLGTSPVGAPIWIVVKAISDFADDARAAVQNSELTLSRFESDRKMACENAARFVLRALANATID